MECSDIISIRLDKGQHGIKQSDMNVEMTKDTFEPNRNGGYFGFGGSDEPYHGPHYDRSFNLRYPDERGPSFNSYCRQKHAK